MIAQTHVVTVCIIVVAMLIETCVQGCASGYKKGVCNMRKCVLEHRSRNGYMYIIFFFLIHWNTIILLAVYVKVKTDENI